MICIILRRCALYVMYDDDNSLKGCVLLLHVVLGIQSTEELLGFQRIHFIFGTHSFEMDTDTHEFLSSKDKNRQWNKIG